MRTIFTSENKTWDQVKEEKFKDVDESRIPFLLYLPSFAFELACFLSVRNHRLNYWWLWRSPNVLHHALTVWWEARKLIHEHMLIVRRKVCRFLNTAFVHNEFCRLLPTRAFRVNVRSQSVWYLNHTKRAFAIFLRKISKDYSFIAAKYLKSKIKFVRQAPHRVSDHFNDHFHLSASFSPNIVNRIPPQQAYFFSTRGDVSWHAHNWHVNIPDDPGTILGESFQQLRWYLAYTGLSTENGYTEFDARHALQFDFPSQLHGSRQIAGTFNGDPAPSSYGAQFMHTIDQLRVICPDSAYIPLDKDNKRRCEMHYLGYLYRLWENFGPKGAPFYSCTNLTKAQAVSVKEQLIKTYIPDFAHPASVSEDNLPKAYQTYKGKCLHQDQGSTGLACQKTHAHEREITNNRKEPCASFLSLGARALRLAWKHSEKEVWTCWNQSKISYEAYCRLSILRSHKDYAQHCPCGKKRAHTISIIRIDAAQFFKSASVDRGVRRVKTFLTRLEHKQGVKAVAVKKGKKASGFLIKKIHRCSKMESRVVPFANIVAGINYASKDKLFCVGETVFSRDRGWPMGGSFSEPATLLDLGTDVHKFYTDVNFQKRVGLHISGMSPRHLIVGMQHVDDAVVASKVFCEECLERGTERIWPKDVGTSIEEKGPTITFMATTIIILPDHGFEVYPTPVNADFAKGLSTFPKISRLPDFQGSEHHTQEDFRQFIVGRIVNINMLSRGSLLHAIPACSALFGEIFKLHWPRAWTLSVLLCFPRKHISQFTRALIRISRRFRADVSLEFDYDTVRDFLLAVYSGSSPSKPCSQTQRFLQHIYNVG